VSGRTQYGDRKLREGLHAAGAGGLQTPGLLPVSGKDLFYLAILTLNTAMCVRLFYLVGVIANEMNKELLALKYHCKTLYEVGQSLLDVIKSMENRLDKTTERTNFLFEDRASGYPVLVRNPVGAPEVGGSS
jgi:hypothetical protein